LKFVEASLQTAEVKTTGTDIDKLLPPTPLFGGNRTEKKQRVIDKLIAFVQKYFGI
jgi:type I restriction enzyme R subunit